MQAESGQKSDWNRVQDEDRLSTERCSWLVMHILCFWFGRTAREYSLKAKAAEEAGDYTAATENRRLARQWNIKGIIGGVVIYAICVFFLFIAIGLGVYNGILRQQTDEILSSYGY